MKSEQIDTPKGDRFSSGSQDLPAICISSTTWDTLVQRPQHIMKRYSRLAPVLYVDPPQRPRREVLVGYARPKLRQVSQQLWWLSTYRAFPLERTIVPIRPVNDLLTKRLVRSVAKSLGIEDFLLWCYHFDSSIFAKTKGAKFMLYECVDDWSSFWHEHRDVEKREAQLIKKSNVVFTTSQHLYDLKKALNPHIYLVPNGVDFEHFNAASREMNVPAPLEDVAHPIMGFTGAVYHWIDLKLIENVARRRKDWSFVFVGPIGSSVEIPQLPNMHFLGKVPYEDLPRYMSTFDVCLLLFRRMKLTESVNPIKMYEYLATGKPIISSDIPEVRKYSNLIDIAEGPDAFERAIDNALKEDSPERSQARQKIAAENSWNHRFDFMMKIINERRAALGV